VSEERTRKIAEQNDLFRAKFHIPYFNLRPAGHMFCTGGIAALPPETTAFCIAGIPKQRCSPFSKSGIEEGWTGSRTIPFASSILALKRQPSPFLANHHWPIPSFAPLDSVSLKAIVPRYKHRLKNGDGS